MKITFSNTNPLSAINVGRFTFPAPVASSTTGSITVDFSGGSSVPPTPTDILNLQNALTLNQIAAVTDVLIPQGYVGGAVVTGAITGGNLLTVTAVTSGTLVLGAAILNAGVYAGTITAFGAGTTGGVGTYTLSGGVNAASTTLTISPTQTGSVLTGSTGTVTAASGSTPSFATLTVASVVYGVITLSMPIYLNGVYQGYISAFGTGTGGTGTYTISGITTQISSTSNLLGAGSYVSSLAYAGQYVPSFWTIPDALGDIGGTAQNQAAFSATPTIDFAQGTNVIMAPVTANITAMTIANPPPVGTIVTFTIPTTGVYTITWPATFKKAADGAAAASKTGTTAFVFNGYNYVQIGGALAFN